MFVCIFGIGSHAIYCPNDNMDSHVFTRLFAQPWMFLFGYSSVEDLAGKAVFQQSDNFADF